MRATGRPDWIVAMTALQAPSRVAKGATAETIRNPAEDQRPDPHPGERSAGEAREAAEIERVGRRRAVDLRADEAGADVAGHEEIIELEEPAERDEDHEPFEVVRRGQAVEPRSDGRRTIRGSGHVRDPFSRHTQMAEALSLRDCGFPARTPWIAASIGPCHSTPSMTVPPRL